MLNLTSAKESATLLARYISDLKHYHLLITIIISCIALLSACTDSRESSSSSSTQTSFKVAVPEFIQLSELPPECLNSLSASLTIDQEPAQIMSITNGEAQVILLDVDTGEHYIHVQFSCTVGEKLVDLVEASKTMHINAGLDSSPLTRPPIFIEFTQDDYQAFDTDNDSVSNLQELELAEDPFVATLPGIPSVSVSSLGQSVIFSADATDVYTAHYNLLAYPRGETTATTLVSNDTDTQINIPFSGYEMLITQYVLQACNASTCTDSVKLDVDLNMLDQVAYIKAFNSDAGDKFGELIAISADGNTLVVCSNNEGGAASNVQLPTNSDTRNAAIDAGAAYVYSRQNGQWIEEAYLKAFNSEAGDRFGYSIALSADGNTVAVAAGYEDGTKTGVHPPTSGDLVNAGVETGAVYVYSRTNSNWVEEAYIKAFITGFDDRFGQSVALSADGNTLAVGAYGEDGATTGVNFPIDSDKANAAVWAGAVFTYVRQLDGWVEEAYIKAFNTETHDRFGTSVALSADGNTLAVGAEREDGAMTGVHLPADADMANAALESGAVYMYSRQSGNWIEDAYIKAMNGKAAERFGSTVTISADGNTLAVGAQYQGGASGAVYIYSRNNGPWIDSGYIKANNSQGSDFFGKSVALSADGIILAVGANQEDGGKTGVMLPTESDIANSELYAGAVYMYVYQNGNWIGDAYVKAFNSQAGDRFGDSVALSADGKTLAVGALDEDGAATGVHAPGNSDVTNTALDAGAVYVY